MYGVISFFQYEYFLNIDGTKIRNYFDNVKIFEKIFIKYRKNPQIIRFLFKSVTPKCRKLSL